MSDSSPKLDQLSVNTIRALSIDTVLKANSGHPGLPLGAAPVGYSLFARTLRHSPKNPGWPDRDRFVLSAGHGSALLYSLLHLTGYDLPLEQLKQFRQLGSQTPGHPERGDTAGVETTTGPLGQGFGNAVGMALAERHLAARFNRPGHEIVDHRTFVLAGDGDLMEGVANEAASLAGHLGLGKLVCFYDSNHICLAASTNLVFTTDVAKVFEGYGWHVQTVGDGNDLAAIAAATDAALAVADRPSLVIVRTEIGFGSPKQGTFGVHGSPLDAAQVIETKKKLGYPSEEPFFIPEDALRHLRSSVERGQAAEAAWRKRFEAYRSAHPDLAAEFERVMAGELPKGWDADIPTFTTAEKPLATRSAGGKVINAIAARVPELIGGSADLNPSTDTALKGAGDFQSPTRQVSDRQGAVGGEWGYSGRNIHFGVREHAMAAIATGIALHGGLIPFSATFFMFADYMRPSIRLASIMKLHSIFVFTHDSIGVGEDGPTHQPVEQAASLRAIPRLVVIRPGDANETASAWRVAMTRKGPVALLLTRQALPVLARHRRRRLRRLRTGRQRGPARRDPDRDGLRAPRGRRRPAAARRPRRQGAGREPAVLGAVRGPAAGVSRLGAAAHGPRARGRRGRRAAGLGPLRRPLRRRGRRRGPLRRLRAGQGGDGGVRLHPRQRRGEGARREGRRRGPPRQHGPEARVR